MVQAITGYSELVVHPDAVIESLSKAIHTSLSQETVSHFSIPTDIFTMTTMIQPNVPVHRTDGHPIKKLQHALELMRAARRP